MDINYLIRRSFQENGARPAVVCDGAMTTYADLSERSQRLANALAGLGLEAGDRVAVLLDNCSEYVEIDLALSLGGYVRVALNARLNTDELRYILEDCVPRVLITSVGYEPLAAEASQGSGITVVQVGGESNGAHGDYESLLSTGSRLIGDVCRSEEATAWISYTSGTTGRPKGVVLSRRTILQVAFNLMLEFGREEMGRSILLTQPMSHASGYFVLPYLMAGGSIHLMGRFDPERVVSLQRKYEIPMIKVVPTMMLDLLEVSGRPDFETILYGAAPVSAEKLELCLERFGPVLAQVYGQSEAPMTITLLGKSDHVVGSDHLQSAGRPWRNIKLEIVDDVGAPVGNGQIGEVAVDAPHVMDGYFGLPEVTAEVLKDGRLRTKDMAVMDDSGYIYLRGRSDEMILSGGYTVAPKEVEVEVSRYPGVAECVVVPLEDPRWGQVAQAFVNVRQGVEFEREDFDDFCRQRLGFRRPRSVIVVGSIPRTAYGKVDRQALEKLQRA